MHIQTKRDRHTHTHTSSKSYIGVTASSVFLQAEVDRRTGVTITLVSIPTHTAGGRQTHKQIRGWSSSAAFQVTEE